MIGDGLLKLSLALMFFALLPPRSSDASGSRGLWALALHVTAPVRLMMNLLFARGLRDVSLSSYLFAC